MAAVGNEGNDKLLTNKELEETCHHINIKHLVCKLGSSSGIHWKTNAPKKMENKQLDSGLD